MWPDNPESRFFREILPAGVWWLIRFKLALVALALLVMALLLIFTMAIFGAPGMAANRTPGGVAGLPPSGAYLEEIPPEIRPLLEQLAREKNLPWEIPAAIVRIESNFGKEGQNYAGLSPAQWQRYALLALGSAQPPDLSSPEKSLRVLCELLAAEGARQGDGESLRRGIAAFRDGRYFERVRQVAGRYGFVLPGSFEEALLSLAYRQLGKPYIWGATGPEAFDCSGLVQYLYRQLQVAVPRNSQQQYFAAEPLTVDQLLPGDLFFLQYTYQDPMLQITHVGLYLGGGRAIHAPQEGQDVALVALDNPFFREHWYGVARVKRPGMPPPTTGLENGGGADDGWQSFDVRRGEPRPEAIDRWLTTCGGQGVRSPQLDEALPGETIGSLYLRMGRQYGLNPAFAVAFFTKESSCGTAGSNLASHNFGNIRWTPGYPTLDRVWRYYPNWNAGMEDWFRLIRTFYLDELHLYTVDRIVAVYAPSSENDTALYIRQVKQRVTTLMQGS
jgi:cell wall-associated NlpC family hydrolase